MNHNKITTYHELIKYKIIPVQNNSKNIKLTKTQIFSHAAQTTHSNTHDHHIQIHKTRTKIRERFLLPFPLPFLYFPSNQTQQNLIIFLIVRVNATVNKRFSITNSK